MYVWLAKASVCVIYESDYSPSVISMFTVKNQTTIMININKSVGNIHLVAHIIPNLYDCLPRNKKVAI